MLLLLHLHLHPLLAIVFFRHSSPSLISHMPSRTLVTLEMAHAQEIYVYSLKDLKIIKASSCIICIIQMAHAQEYTYTPQDLKASSDLYTMHQIKKCIALHGLHLDSHKTQDVDMRTCRRKSRLAFFRQP